MIPKQLIESAIVGTENRIFALENNVVLIPEVTNYIRAIGPQGAGSNKVYYVARCFRDETAPDKESLREFTQIGVEFLGDNALDCRKIVRRDAIKIFKDILYPEDWTLVDGVERGLNLYDSSGKTFEITSSLTKKQLLGGGPYDGGAGWALGLERLMIAMSAR